MEPQLNERSPSVLVVDDNPDDLTTFQRALRGIEVRFDTAATGREGLEKALSGTYDLIVLDYNLGDMTGTEILLRLKEAGPTPPILIQSGIGSHFVVARALALGAEGFIAKDSPDYAGEVRAKLEAHVGRRPRAAMPVLVRGERRQPIVELDRAIDDLVERSRGSFSAVGFASPDGFRVTSRMRRVGSLTAETICAMVASATSTSRFLGQGLDAKDLRLITADFAGGTLYSAPVGDFGFLFAVCPSIGAAAHAAKAEFELAIRELHSLLEALTKVQRSAY